MNNELMSAAMLAELRAAYATIERIDPALPSYGKLIALLDASSQKRLKQLAGANIKFISKLALNRVEIER